MKIKKTYQGAVPLNRISNQGDNSELNTYSTQYLNEKLYSFSQSQPKNNEGIWFQQGKNLFNKNDVMVGWLNEDGSIYYEETYRTSNFISVKPGIQYYKTATNSARFKFYDADLNPLTNKYNDIANADQALAFIVPDNAHYIRFSMKIEYIHDVQVEVGNSATEYEEYIGEHLYFKNELGYKEFSNSDIAIGSRQPINGESVWMYVGKNLLNSYSLVPQNKNRATTTQTATGFDFTFITPLIGSGEGYYTYDILFKQGVTYYMHCDSSTGVRFGNVRLTDDINNIDSNFQAWTQGSNGLDFFITPNQDYHCMRIWVTNSSGSESASDTGSIFNMMITSGADAWEYEPYTQPKIFVKNNDGGYEEFYKPVTVTDGVEFETGRIVNGKKEYCTRLNLGPLPNATAIDYPTGLDSSYVVTHYHLYGLGSDTRCFSLPFFNLSNPSYHVLGYVKGGPSVVCTKSNYDVSAYDLIVEISYIK